MFELHFGFPVPGALRHAHGYTLRWASCAVMGIVNVTPDSFSDGGRGAEAALIHAEQLLQDQALILDIGGESTRPGAEPVDAATELDRVLPVIRGLRGSSAVISVDTLKPEVADAALRAGAHLVNDVSGLRDPQMQVVCAQHAAPACLMHMQGQPQTMQLFAHYEDVVAEVFGFLRSQAEQAKAAGVPSLLLDPGIGFGKTLTHNLTLLRHLSELTAGESPVLVGGSRKRFLGTLSGEPHAAASTRDAASLALHLHAARHGSALVRVHDVRSHVLALRVQAALESA
ncbi:dihydropteroate synthase [Deinococcus detaillensis]|uniref:Dihydropteroate synthase n=1 Tax=Deinococcus detaillensis TaxID=2592048 RepID=A0A553UZH2_9DEIO|nr:dihydropteroate synthase [Deinococcus detaillensis]TSA85623.1 dihydropteroate synthase [Deinococcus detaillensis]